MAKKLILGATEGIARVKVYRDSGDREYSVRLWCGDRERTNAAYFTDDKQDAFGTARAMLEHNDCTPALGCGCRQGR